MAESIHDESCGCEPGTYCHDHRPGPSTPETYPCEKCGKPRHVALDGTPLAVCEGCWDGPEEIRTTVMSWRVEHYRVNGLEVFPAFESHLYDPVVMLQCAHCLKAYGAEKIATIPRHRESLEAQIEALKAERDEWRDKAGLHQIASAAHKDRADRLEELRSNEWRKCATHPDVNGAIMWGCPDCLAGLRRESSNQAAELASSGRIQLKAEVARLEGLILEWDSQIGRPGPIHDEAEAIKARKGR